MCLAVPGKIEEIFSDDTISRKGRANFGGLIKEVFLAHVPEAQVGDYVIVHVGFAISIVNEQEAQRTLNYLDQLEEPEAGHEIS